MISSVLGLFCRLFSLFQFFVGSAMFEIKRNVILYSVRVLVPSRLRITNSHVQPLQMCPPQQRGFLETVKDGCRINKGAVGWIYRV